MEGQKKALYILCASILPLMICSGMVYSILALYISDLGATKTQIGLIYMTGAIAGAVFAPTMGKLSDRFGRKPILIISMIGFMLAFSLYSLIRNYMQAFPIYAVEGATWAAMGPTASAFIADIIPPKERGWALGMYSRTWHVGWIIGPILGGFLADTIGFRSVFLIGSGLIIFGLISVMLYIEEPKK